MLYYYIVKQMIKTMAFLAALLLSAVQAHADVKVIVSIKPIHSLVAAVMQGAGKPELLLKGASSPHIYTLKPSDAEALSQADVIFWVGPELETFLSKPIETLSTPEKSVALINASLITKLLPRTGPGFADDGEHNTIDPHIWLSPDNAKAMVAAIASRLSAVDLANTALYEGNAESEIKRINDMQVTLQAKLAPIISKHFIVFHDAYHYFEKSFGLSAKGAIAIHPENPPSAAVLTTLRATVLSSAATCVFSEPQFDPKLVQILVEGTSAKTGILDPLGANEAPGPNLYFNVMEALAKSLSDCLSS
jgi:zinc transport system substrate-binding protein